MDNVAQYRRTNLQLLASQMNGYAQLARAIGRDATYISQMAGKGAYKPVSDGMAESIERSLRLPKGWLSTPRHSVADLMSDKHMREVYELFDEVSRSSGLPCIGERRRERLVGLLYNVRLRGEKVNEQSVYRLLAHTTPFSVAAAEQRGG